MTRKDYIVFAEMLKHRLNWLGADDNAGRAVVLGLTGEIADIFERENPRFDRERFYRAAGAPQ